MNNDTLQIEPIAYIRSDFPEKFGIPRQSGLARTRASVIFTPAFRSEEAVRGLQDFTHIWLIWGFSANRKTDDGAADRKIAGMTPDCKAADMAPDCKAADMTPDCKAADMAPDCKAAGLQDSPAATRQAAWHPTVRPPRLGGNTRIGVFASRSPFRPNGLGLSSVKLISVITQGSPKADGADPLPVLVVEGADLMDGTPIYDIKPYIPYADSHPDASGGFTDHVPRETLTVHFPEPLLACVPAGKKEGLMDLLAQDPRPSYQHDPNRIYGLSYAGINIQFCVADGLLTVIAVDEL